MAVAYGYSYYEALSIPLTELKQIMKGAIDIYERKILLQEAILKYLGVNK